MFTNTYLPHIGGVAKSVATFTEDLQKCGHSVLVIAPTFAGLQKENEPGILRVPAIQNFNGSDFSVRIPVPGVVHDAVKHFKADLIHSHHPFLLGDTALRTARLFDLPLIFTHHTLYERYTHYVPLDSDVLKRFVITLATEYANLCHRVLAPSIGVAKLLVDRGVRTKVEVLPTGIDLPFFASGKSTRFRKQYKIPDDALIIGHVGRLAREKNIPYLARAVVDALHRINNSFFVVAGSGKAEEGIKEIFARKNLHKRLRMVGSLTGGELADCYKAMDLFAFASHSETQGLVLAEAMAASTPVVALRATGVDDVIEDGMNGVRLDQNSSEKQMSEALRRALTDRSQLAKWRDNALKTAKKFAREKSTVNLVDIYRRTCANTANPHVFELDLLDEAFAAIKTEWKLLQEKAVAAVNSLSRPGKER